jgi:hypothetical protein
MSAAWRVGAAVVCAPCTGLVHVAAFCPDQRPFSYAVRDQEAKVPEAKMTAEMACAPGFEVNCRACDKSVSSDCLHPIVLQVPVFNQLLAQAHCG